jgi:DNA-binding SARP family transcriptional activator
MRFSIFGPTQLWRADGREVTVGGPRLRALLALLLVDAGNVVAGERLIDGLCGGNPPGDAANALQSQVSRLPQLLRDDDRRGSPVELHPAGHRLAVEADEVDAHRFERLAAEGRRALAAGDHPRAATLLREALDLWRGPALSDVGDVPFAQAQAVRLEELRVSAVEDHVEAELALGGHPTLVAELERLVAAYALRERLRGQLMRALYAGGRQAEALAVFEEARRTLAELGAAGLIFQAIGHPRIFYGLPLQAFLFLVALGVDYTIFLMTRAREETAELGQTAAGVLRALTVTGGVSTSAGLVLAATFSALTVLPLVPSVQIGIIVAVGVLLDTLVVRSLLIPALAVHIGARVWWPSRLGAQPTQPTPAQAARARQAEPTRMR